MNIIDLPYDILVNIKIPVEYEVGEIYIEENIYSNYLACINNNIFPIDLKAKIRNFIISKLQPITDYQIGCTWIGQEWSHGPADFPLTESCFIQFVMPSGFETYKICQNNILNKVAKLIDDFSSELSTKCHIKEDIRNNTATKTYLIYYIKQQPFNFHKISKQFSLSK